MSLNNYGFGGKTAGRATANANTVIKVLLQPKGGGIGRVSTLGYTTGNTAHTITGMRPLGRTTAASAANAAQNTITLTADPGPSGNGIAANDLVAVRESDGVTRDYVVSAWNSSTKVVTLVANLVAAVAAGAKFWDFGITSDTDPLTGTAHPTIVTTANTTQTFQDDVAGVVAGHEKDAPILLNSSNGTAAGSFDRVSYAYTKN